MLSVAPMLALFGASYLLIIAWLGPQYATSGEIALILGAGYTVNIATALARQSPWDLGAPTSTATTHCWASCSMWG